MAQGQHTGYAWYVTGVLTLAYTFSFIDRQILTLLVEPIRQDLGLSDTQISLLHGMAFAVFYTFMGIPLGRLADSGNRRALIAVGIAVWSLMTAACGLARGFWQLFAARVGVAVGEAALSPSAYSLISDYFPKEKLGQALGVYNMGIYLGGGLAYIVGGGVVHWAMSAPPISLPLTGTLAAWQITFLVVGLPGLIVAALMLTVREPARRGLMTVAGKVPFGQAMRYLGRRWRLYAPLIVGTALLSLSGYASSTWIPTFLIRVYGWTPGQTGLFLGLIVLIFGTAGVYGGGWLADRLTSRGMVDAHPRIIMWSALALLAPSVLLPFMTDPLWALMLYAPAALAASAPFGVASAALQMVTPNELRGQIAAIYLFVANLLGLGLGPTLVALITDYVFVDPMMVGYSLALVVLAVAPLSALVMSRAIRPFREAVTTGQ